MAQYKTKLKPEVREIYEYFRKSYGISLNKDDKEFLESILQRIRSKAHAEGYEDCYNEDLEDDR